MSTTAPPTHSKAPQGWVPVERRWLGFDKATAPYAGFVAVMIIVMHFVIPSVNRALAYDNVVQVGDVIQVTSSVTFQPAVGWNIERGFRQNGEANTSNVGPKNGQAVVTDGDVSFTVTVAPFDGSPAQLLAQIRRTSDALNDEADFHVVGKSAAFVTSAGSAGRISRYASRDSTGVIAAVTNDGVGVEVVSVAATEMDEETVTEIATMLASLTFTKDGA